MFFSNTWFDDSELKSNIDKYLDPNKINTILEIGSFEGASACFFSNNYLNAEGSTLTCVDPFDVSDSTSPLYQDIKNIFLNNIILSKNWQKIRLQSMYSNEFFKDNTKHFNFIYIDGSHLIENIQQDFNNALNVCTSDGIIWMDDYLGGQDNKIKTCIDNLYEHNKNKLEIIHIGYQIGFRMLY